MAAELAPLVGDLGTDDGAKSVATGDAAGDVACARALCVRTSVLLLGDDPNSTAVRCVVGCGEYSPEPSI